LYLQKRSETKDIQPGKWDTAVGGHVDYGETIEIDNKEVTDGKFWNVEKIRQNLENQIFTSNFVNEFKRILNSQKDEN
jgi:isopentenyldiphosphate isomerase